MLVLEPILLRPAAWWMFQSSVDEGCWFPPGRRRRTGPCRLAVGWGGAPLSRSRGSSSLSVHNAPSENGLSPLLLASDGNQPAVRLSQFAGGEPGGCGVHQTEGPRPTRGSGSRKRSVRGILQHSHTRAHTHMHTLPHTCTRVHTHTCTHTLSHTHAPVLTWKQRPAPLEGDG